MESNVQKKARILASVKLNEKQVQNALMQYTAKDEQLKDLLSDQETVAWVNWHVNKWDNPDTFCTISFGAVITDDEPPAPGVSEPSDEQ